MNKHEISAIRTAGDYDYTCDMRRLPRLSDGERGHLVSLLAESRASCIPSHSAQQAQERLIEGHLWLATTVAWEWCPKERRPLIPDLIQEASLCLTQFAASFDYTSGENFTAWATVALRDQVRRTIGDDRFVRVPRSTRSRLRKAGRIADLDTFQPLSLDEIRMEDEECTLYSFVPEPEVPYNDPQQGARKRALLEAWLAQLSPSAQQVTRLSFGLCDEDGRAQTPGEIAASLGVAPSNISSIKRSALLKLKAIAQGRAREQRKRAGAPSRQRATTHTSRATEKHGQLERAALYLQREGQLITTAHLARLAEESFLTADKFLRRREHPANGTSQPRAQRLEAALACLQTTGKHITAYALAKQADVHVKTAERFLEREGMLPVQNPQARCAEQLERAYAQMQAEGAAITSSALARRAGVHPYTAQRFLEARQPERASRRTSKYDPERQTLLEQAYASLQTQGKAITERVLARHAGVCRNSAKHFLYPHSPVDKGRSRPERLEDAYTQLQTERKNITASSLARVAQVHWSTATRFLQKRQPVPHEQESQPEREVCYV
jgi:RNA polymerase sigma factor (sigma-70 family)